MYDDSVMDRIDSSVAGELWALVPRSRILLRAPISKDEKGSSELLSAEARPTPSNLGADADHWPGGRPDAVSRSPLVRGCTQ